MSNIDELLRLFLTRGQSLYGGEAISQVEHALQAALLAENAGARPELIAAALLHDVGHLLDEESEASGRDPKHEDAGAAWLADHFPPGVVRPIRLHVAAKRYLCAARPSYREQLSPESLRTLDLQGGPMSPPERTEFEADPHHREAIDLRGWDDAAKVPGLATRDVHDYRDLLEGLWR